jgi:heme oxygenase
LSARFALRAATRFAHERVDAAFAGHNLADRADYRRFLAAHAAALVPIEEALTLAGARRLVDEWDNHRRAPLLLADLAILGAEPVVRLEPAEIRQEPELAGALYVLEGSRLGGAVLAKRVPSALPATFLSAPQAPGRWTRFAMSLDQLLDTPPKLAAAAAAALAVFRQFELAAEQVA